MSDDYQKLPNEPLDILRLKDCQLCIEQGQYRLKFDAETVGNAAIYKPILIDVMCHPNASAFPPEIRSLMSLALPYETYDHNITMSSWTYTEEKDLEKNQVSYFLNICKDSAVTKEKVLSTLTKIGDKGDPLIMIELYRQNTTWVKIPTKASLLKASLENDTSCVFIGELPVLKKRSNAWKLFRWWLFPLLVMILLWILLVQPELLDKYYINQTMFDRDWLASQSVTKLLPIYPKDSLEAFDYGMIVDQLEIAEAAGNQAKIDEIIDQVKNMTGRETVTVQQIKDIRPEIQKMLDKKSIIQRVWGFFTFVNIIWMVSIIGLTISVGPCLYAIVGPFLIRFARYGFDIFKRIVIFLMEKLVIPIFTFLHNWGFFEILIYMLSFQLIREGSMMDITEQFGFMIVVSGMFMLTLAYGYSTYLHTRKIRSDGKHKDLVLNMVMVWYVLCAVPMAILMQSTFLGYVTFSIVFTLLGFRMIFFGLGIAIGWDDEDTMEQSAFASGLLLVAYILVRENFKLEYYLAPFASSVLILGGNILLLAMLIMSSQYYHRYGREKRYIPMNILMLLILAAGLFTSTTLSMDGLRNTIIVYGILWAIEKYHELFFALSKNVWIYVFTISALSYYLALKINSNPQFVIDMFKVEKY